VLDGIEVTAGYEAALGAALGDDLVASDDEGAPAHWRALPPIDDAAPLPDRAEPLDEFVDAPPALARRLSQVGVVADEEAGEELREELASGQRLVTADGALWRWDGYTVMAGAATPAAARLEQRNRLAEARPELARAEKRLATREALAEASSAFTANSSRLAAIEDSAERLAADLAEADMLLAKARDAEDDTSFAGEDRAKLKSLREEVGAVRTTLAEARHAFNRLQVEAAGRGDRIETIANEAAAWGRRTETRLGGIEGRLKAAEAALADAREDRGRCEGAVSQAELALSTVVERVDERLGCAPADALVLAELKDGEALPEIDVIDIRVDRLLRERENMGPVNLRAEHEAEDLGEQITTMQDERADLLSAITRLRHGIAELNREGRERLLKSFEEVNQHFQELFVRLFGGGRAHLTLTESDDPLESGLEIMASPPGKRLQVMSLLSGGEQALTAISLLFAVFLTNPAPICILDEVDAPLDDANVDRFCSMIDEIAHASQTRFLLITHHRMTMARMDRLFGVTMPERGVSQLVSVDLQSAESLRASA
jgi:chromosome segregation protein